MKVKEESEKVGLKLNTHKTKIMAAGPITSWQIDRETMEPVTDFILGGSPLNYKILAPWKKSYDKPRQYIKNRDITLPTKGRLVKAMVFPLVVYRCESWTIKKT